MTTALVVDGVLYTIQAPNDVFALDATSGALLWSVQLGGQITANPISYGIDGRQYVAIAADRVVYVFGLP